MPRQASARGISGNRSESAALYAVLRRSRSSVDYRAVNPGIFTSRLTIM